MHTLLFGHCTTSRADGKEGWLDVWEAAPLSRLTSIGGTQ